MCGNPFDFIMYGLIDGMAREWGVEEKEIKKIIGRRKLIRFLSLIVLILGGLYYSLTVYAFYSFKGGPDDYTWIVDIAQGYATAENDYRGLPIDVTEENPLTCKSQFARDGVGTLGFCGTLFNRGNFSECSWWRFEKCQVLEGEAYLLSRPELLGRALSAVHDPCRYVPTMEYIKSKYPSRDRFKWSTELSLREFFECGGVPDDFDPYGQRPGRAFVKLFNEEGDVVFFLEIQLKE